MNYIKSTIGELNPPAAESLNIEHSTFNIEHRMRERVRGRERPAFFSNSKLDVRCWIFDVHHKFLYNRLRSVALLSLLMMATGCAHFAGDPLAEKKAKAPSVVRIATTTQIPSFYSPWIWRAPQTKSGQGIVVGENLVLTLASNVMNAKMIEMTLDAEPVPTQLKVVALELNANLALLKGDLPKSAKALVIPETTNFIPGEPVRMYWKTANGMIMGSDAVLDTVETRYNFNSSQGLAMYHAVKSSHPGNGWGTPVFDSSGSLLGLSLAGGSDYDFHILTCDTINKVMDLNKGALKTPTAVPGFATAPLTQPYLRKSLGVSGIDGGCMIIKVFEQGSGNKKLKNGDVLLSVCGNKLDAWGRYDDPISGTPLTYGRIFSQHYVTDAFPIEIVRDGKRMKLDLDLSSVDYDKWLVSSNPFNKKMPYLIRGGFVFIPLSKTYLKEWGGDFQNKAPLYLVDAWKKNMYKIKSEKVSDVVLISRVLSHPSNLGFQGMRNMIVSKVDGNPVKSLAHLNKVIGNSSKKIVKLTLQPGDVPLWLSPNVLKSADAQIKKRYGISKLSYIK